MGHKIFDILIDVSLLGMLVHIDAFWSEPGVEVFKIDHHLSVGLKDIVFIGVFEVVLDIEVVEFVLDEVDVTLLSVLFVVDLEVEHFVQGVGVESGVFFPAVVRVWDVFEFFGVKVDFGEERVGVLSQFSFFAVWRVRVGFVIILRFWSKILGFIKADHFLN